MKINKASSPKGTNQKDKGTSTNEFKKDILQFYFILSTCQCVAKKDLKEFCFQYVATIWCFGDLLDKNLKDYMAYTVYE